ncbi:Class I histocompatibility antigen, Gogo-C*0101/C*0102 alpha chain [Myotis davidii]|uniref:Class I histocompatibility antigen, Gogo-C*0101/C*0102 alpha chain n=1 Tax=Myotis davidii TaxID=225400 RepID=L5LNP6_MYODS|nr:Class I histocompatibility antigen, Gogo-C*0101/C*0102 alpha chain [Myotis davidii]
MRVMKSPTPLPLLSGALVLTPTWAAPLHGSEDGSHTFQVVYGCDVGPTDASHAGHCGQSAYEGAGCSALNEDLTSRTAAHVAAPITCDAEHPKSYLKGSRMEWLRVFLEKGKETLQRADPPSTWDPPPPL